MAKTSPDSLLIGAHTSTSGGLYNALLEGEAIGATTIQLFTSNQRQWKGRVLTEEIIEKFERTLAETSLSELMSHASYLINLGSPDPVTRKKSQKAFREEVERCIDLGISYLNFHPGASLKESRELAMERIVEGMLLVEDLLEEEDLTLLLETTAGQGSVIGYTFEELAFLIEKTHKRLPVGVCVDTCHIFAAGYDIRTATGWRKTLKEFDEVIGLDFLHAFHLNDSMKELASRRDRHAPLGEGEIGIECFHFLMTDPKTQKIPKYLETPGGPPLWEKEIWKLRDFAR